MAIGAQNGEMQKTKPAKRPDSGFFRSEFTPFFLSDILSGKMVMWGTEIKEISRPHQFFLPGCSTGFYR